MGANGLTRDRIIDTNHCGLPHERVGIEPELDLGRKDTLRVHEDHVARPGVDI